MKRIIPAFCLALVFVTMAWADDTDKNTTGSSPAPALQLQIDNAKPVDEQKAAEKRRREHQLKCDDIANHSQKGKTSADYLECISKQPN